MEHVQQPDICFAEIYRVLKPGGLFISKTPNKWHYVPTLARMTPHSFHILYNKLRGQKERDTFPTVYKCNTPGAVKAYAQGAGFQPVDIRMWEGRPEYLRTASPLYLAGFLYERLVNSIPFLAKFRVVMVFALLKPQA
jgi:SAM-dependent methyltransferase